MLIGILCYLLILVSLAFWWKVVWPKRWHQAWLETRKASQPSGGASALSFDEVMKVRSETPLTVREDIDAASGLPTFYTVFRFVVVVGSIAAISASIMYIVSRV